MSEIVYSNYLKKIMVEHSGSASLAITELDVIKKPRTNYSSNVLRRVLPNVNIEAKRVTFSMMKLKVLTDMKLGSGKGDALPRKVKTLQQVPKILTIISGSQQQLPQITGSRIIIDDGIQAIAEEKRDEGDSDSENDSGSGGSSSEEDSSIDGGGEDDEDRLYADIMVAQSQDQETIKVDDLVDKEMIQLLRVCSQFKCPSLEEIADKRVFFGLPAPRTKTLVLDMDETLIHARFLTTPAMEAEDDGDFIVSIASASSADVMRISVKMRPFLDNCLEHLSQYYEIAVFTAGEQGYADAVLDYLDEERKIIKHRLYRQHCLKVADGVYVKDLRVIADRHIKDIILVDNSIVSFAFNLDNGVPISAFVRQQQDEELLYLVSYLEEVFSFPDTRQHIGNTFKLKQQMELHAGKHGHHSHHSSHHHKRPQ